MPAKSSLLLDEYPLILLPTAACVFGDRPALFLQQVHYWCKLFERQRTLRHYHRGRWWVWNSLEGWQTQFPFWSTRTIERIITRLQHQDLILIDNYNLMSYDRTRWYTPHYEVITPTIETWERKRDEAQPPSCQTVMMEQAKLSEWIMTDCHDGTSQSVMMDHDRLACTIPETTQRLDTQISTELANIWTNCINELSFILPRATCDTSISRAELTAYNPTDATATITCDSTTVYRQMKQLHPHIMATMAAILCQPTLTIHYTERSNL